MEDVGWLFIQTAVCICFSLFFSANASALRSFSRRKLQEAFKQKDKEEVFEKFTSSSENLLYACKTYRLVFNTLLIIVFVRAFENHGDNSSPMLNYLWVSLISLFLLLSSSLAIPYAWAKYGGEVLLSHTYPILKISTALIRPLIEFFGFSDKVIKRLSGYQELSEEEDREEKHDELMEVVEQSMADGVVDNEELEMIENVLVLDETTAGEIITPRTELVAVETGSSLNEVLEKIIGAGHSRLPVYEDRIDNILGLVYAKDLLAEIGKKTEQFQLKDYIRPAYFIPETKSLRELLHEFQNKKQHIAVVLDEYGGVVGIVTIEDILEELVGEIEDEYEKKSPASIKVIDADKVLELDAKVYVEDLNSEFDVNLPENEDYDTVGGFVSSYLGYIPQNGELFDYENLRFRVLSAEPRKINRLRIEKLKIETAL
ncbi:MAG: hemolysin family protein [Sedimentisphaeraceae bacterium JB056]